jgi:D-glycero-D-manno-heptose 1,7-bisphosphate phosphatase
MNADLAEIGVAFDGIYVCRHNWDDGCDCRKPKPGLLYQAQKDHSINLTQAYLIGDDERDMEAGRAAGVKKCFLVDDNHTLWDIVKELP